MSTHTYKAGERLIPQRPPRGSAAERQEFMVLRGAFKHICRTLGGSSFEVRFSRRTGILIRTHDPRPTAVEINIIKSLGGEE